MDNNCLKKYVLDFFYIFVARIASVFLLNKLH